VEAMFAAGQERVNVPAWVVDYESFRRWMHTNEFPDEGLVAVINGKLWVDLSMEEFFDHGQVKVEVGRVLGNLMKETRYGRFAPDNTRYSHPATVLTTEPDGMIVSSEGLRTGRVELVSGGRGKDTEVVGTPDIVIEIVSPSSEDKDTAWLMSAYHNAGIPEYWLIDAREADDIQFDIYRRETKGYIAARKRGGWVRSTVLGRSFRFVHSDDEDGNPEYTLEVR
jgi:Uma2 family endonuclease